MDIYPKPDNDDANAEFAAVVDKSQDDDDMIWLNTLDDPELEGTEFRSGGATESAGVEFNVPATDDEGIETFDVGGRMGGDLGADEVEQDEGFAEKAKNVVSDIVKGVLVEGVPQAASGSMEALGEVGDLLEEMLPMGGLQITDPETGALDLELLSSEEFAESANEDLFRQFQADEADTVTGGFIKSTSQFLTGFLPAAKGLKAVGLAGQTAKGVAASSLAAGAIADAVVFDPYEDRLSTYLNSVPALEGLVPDYLADNDPENNSAWEGRMKNAIEGAGLGLMADGLLRAFKYYKMQRAENGGEKAEPITVKEQAVRDQMADDQLDSGAQAIDDAAIAPLGNPDLDDMFIKGKDDEDLSVALERLGAAERRQEPEVIEGVIQDVAKGQKLRRGKLKSEDKIFVNHARIREPSDVKNLIQTLVDADADNINAKRGGETVSLKQQIKSSDQEYNDLKDLIGRDPGPMSAPQAIAARRIMNASGEQVKGLAERAAADTATSADLYNFRRAMVVHYAIQAEVIAARTETARALGSWRVFTGSTKKARDIVCDI